jgi:hypothetical protein
MRLWRIGKRVVGCFFWTLILLLVVLADSNAATDQKFELLQYGTNSYQNVTVTTKSRDYIIITHATGMTTLRVTNLSPEVLQKLGYIQPGKPTAAANAALAMQKVATVEKANLKGVEDQLRNSRLGASLANLHPAAVPKGLLLSLVAILLALYFFSGFCCKRLVEKTGNEPGILVWFPVLRLFPLVRAAGMSPVWVLAFFVPLLNVVAAVIWCLKISEVRGKSPWFALLLMLPVTGPFAFLYLAFSKGGRRDKGDRRIEIMTLETA